MADYMPGPDADFNAWQSNFVTYANANLAALGLVAADMTPVRTGPATLERFVDAFMERPLCKGNGKTAPAT